MLNSTADFGDPFEHQNGSDDRHVDVKAELDALLISLEVVTSDQPNPNDIEQTPINTASLGHSTGEPIVQQQAVYESLQIIQAQVATQSEESAQKLRQYQESIQSLSQTIASDRLQMARMSGEMSVKLNNFHALNAQFTTMHAQMVETSQMLQSKVTQIDRLFAASQSMRVGQEQFAALTAETIATADSIQSQLAEIVQQIGDDRQSIAALKAEVESLRKTVRQEAQQKLINFDLRDRELISLYTNLQARQKIQMATVKKFSIWLSILSGVVGATLLLLIRVWIGMK
ncbi:hypothetical protein [Chamaesiphon sp.]|uniref:hypothetical protein n=1 Tax=Chamaesiphon sp. TaxID=2814140 RepID=UPI0035938839